jgi:hypothetical protein
MPSDRGTISLTFQQFDINATWARLLLRSASLQLSLMSTETGCLSSYFQMARAKTKTYSKAPVRSAQASVREVSK